MIAGRCVVGNERHPLRLVKNRLSDNVGGVKHFSRTGQCVAPEEEPQPHRLFRFGSAEGFGANGAERFCAGILSEHRMVPGIRRRDLPIPLCCVPHESIDPDEYRRSISSIQSMGAAGESQSCRRQGT